MILGALVVVVVVPPVEAQRDDDYDGDDVMGNAMQLMQLVIMTMMTILLTRIASLTYPRHLSWWAPELCSILGSLQCHTM